MVLQARFPISDEFEGFLDSSGGASKESAKSFPFRTYLDFQIISHIIITS